MPRRPSWPRTSAGSSSARSIKHGGRAVKWLGDGVMLHFPNPGPGVAAALDMVDGVADAGLPPAHVGLHAGPVIFQEGDYYGRTVNLAARIAGYAQPGQVLVSQALVDLSTGPGLAFTAVGPVELKGVAARPICSPRTGRDRPAPASPQERMTIRTGTTSPCSSCSALRTTALIGSR